MEKPPSFSAIENEIYADVENKNGSIIISKAENPIYREIEVEDGEETYDEPFSLPGFPSSVTMLGTSASSGNPLIEDFDSVDYASIDRTNNLDYSQVTIPMEDIYESLDKNHEVNVRMPTSENVYTELSPTPPSGYSTLDRLTMNDYNSSYQADNMYQELNTDKWWLNYRSLFRIKCVKTLLMYKTIKLFENFYFILLLIEKNNILSIKNHFSDVLLLLIHSS